MNKRQKVCQLVTFVFFVRSWVCESVNWSIITWEIKANANLCHAMSVASLYIWDANVAKTEHVKRVTRHSICPLICTQLCITFIYWVCELHVLSLFFRHHKRWSVCGPRTHNYSQQKITAPSTFSTFLK